MTDFPYEFQANFKFGPQYKETLVNVPARSPEEMIQKLDWITTNAAKFVAAQVALQTVPGPLAPHVANTQVQQDQPPAPTYQQGPPPAEQQTQWGQPQQSAPPPWSQPAQTAPSCQHGPRIFKEGDGAKGHWKAWFCSAPKGPGQCEAQWIK